MGGKCPHRKVKKRRLSHKTARRGKFLLNADDAVYDELVKLADKGKDCEGKALPVDEDLPGMGQFYCLHCEYASLLYQSASVFFLSIITTNIHEVLCLYIKKYAFASIIACFCDKVG
jgi:bud site selection protein 20